MHVSGLKEALEAKYEELGEVEIKIKKVEAEVCVYCKCAFFLQDLFFLLPTTEKSLKIKLWLLNDLKIYCSHLHCQLFQ